MLEAQGRTVLDFYSRPCGRGDDLSIDGITAERISTHAPAGGATSSRREGIEVSPYFYSRPCGRGDGVDALTVAGMLDFYSRPCGRGDSKAVL